MPGLESHSEALQHNMDDATVDACLDIIQSDPANDVGLTDEMLSQLAEIVAVWDGTQEHFDMLVQQALPIPGDDNHGFTCVPLYFETPTSLPSSSSPTDDEEALLPPGPWTFQDKNGHVRQGRNAWFPPIWEEDPDFKRFAPAMADGKGFRPFDFLPGEHEDLPGYQPSRLDYFETNYIPDPGVFSSVVVHGGATTRSVEEKRDFTVAADFSHSETTQQILAPDTLPPPTTVESNPSTQTVPRGQPHPTRTVTAADLLSRRSGKHLRKYAIDRKSVV